MEGHRVERERERGPDGPLTARSKWDRLENMAPVFVGLIIVFFPAHPPSSLCLGVGEARSAARAVSLLPSQQTDQAVPRGFASVMLVDAVVTLGENVSQHCAEQV